MGRGGNAVGAPVQVEHEHGAIGWTRYALQREGHQTPQGQIVQSLEESIVGQIGLIDLNQVRCLVEKGGVEQANMRIVSPSTTTTTSDIGDALHWYTRTSVLSACDVSQLDIVIVLWPSETK